MLDWHTPSALLSILIASHDERTIVDLSTLLAQQGHVVHSISNDDFVVPSVERYRPDVCILELDLATSGSVAQTLRSLPPSRRPFLIGVSPRPPRPNDELLASNAGFDQFFAKETDAASLVEFISSIGTRRRRKRR